MALQRLVERLLARVDHIPQVTEGHELADGQLVAPVHQELEEQPQGGALALEEARHAHEHVDQGGGERVDAAERGAVTVGSRERVDGAVGARGDRGEGGVDLGPGGLGARREQALLDDGGQVAVGKVDGAEAALLPLQAVGEAGPLRAGDGVADEVVEVALAGDDRDDRHRPGRRALDQQGQLRALAGDEVGVGDAGRQPQDQLVEEQHDRVVAQVLRVPRDRGQPLVQGDVALPGARGEVGVGGEERADEVSGQTAAILVVRVGGAGMVEGFGVPPSCEVAEALKAARASECGEELDVTEAGAELRGVGEQLLVGEDGGQRGVGVESGHMADVAAQHARLHRRLADEVVRDEQDVATAELAVVLDQDRRELRLGTGRRVVLQQQVQHGHEMGLAGAEGAVEIGALGAAVGDRGGDESQRLIEGGGELLGDHVLRDGPVRVRDPVRERDDEVGLLHAGRDVDEVTQQPGGVDDHETLSFFRRPRVGAGGRQLRRSSVVTPSAAASLMRNPAKNWPMRSP